MAQSLRSRRENSPDDASSVQGHQDSSSNDLLDFMKMMAEERKQEREAEQRRQEADLQRFHELFSTMWQRQEQIDKNRDEEQRRKEEIELRNRVERDQRENDEKRQWEERLENERREWFTTFRPELSSREPNLKRMVHNDDIENFLTMFERVATAYKWKDDMWALKLAPLLIGPAQAAFANMAKEDSTDYHKVKAAILKRYDINEETYRQRFRTARPKPNESFTEFQVRIRDLFTKWTHSDTCQVPNLVDTLILEQVLNSFPATLQVWVREQKPKSPAEAAELADNYLLARKATPSSEPPRCYLCKQPGHFARECPETPLPRRNTKPPTDSKTLGPRDFQTKPKDIRCFSCQQLGHISTQCPAKRKPSNGSSYFAQTIRNKTNNDIFRSPLPENKFRCTGTVEGQDVEILLDTGCSKTLVHAELVAKEKLNWERTVKLCCAHGNVETYPTAEINIVVKNNSYTLTAGVCPNLPRPVLLGRDIGNLLELTIQAEAAFGVFTRAQTRRNEKQEAVELVREMVCQVKLKSLEEISSQEDNQMTEPSPSSTKPTTQAEDTGIQFPEEFFSPNNDLFVANKKRRNSKALHSQGKHHSADETPVQKEQEIQKKKPVVEEMVLEEIVQQAKSQPNYEDEPPMDVEEVILPHQEISVQAPPSGTNSSKKSAAKDKNLPAESLNVQLMIERLDLVNLTNNEIQKLVDVLLDKQKTSEQCETSGDGPDPLDVLKKQLSEKEVAYQKEHTRADSLALKTEEIMEELLQEKAKHTNTENTANQKIKALQKDNEALQKRLEDKASKKTELEKMYSVKLKSEQNKHIDEKKLLVEQLELASGEQKDTIQLAELQKQSDDASQQLTELQAKLVQAEEEDGSSKQALSTKEEQLSKQGEEIPSFGETC